MALGNVKKVVWYQKAGDDMNQDCRIRAATLNDIPGIQRVADQAWKDTYRSILPDSLIGQFLENAYSRDALSHAISRDVNVSRFRVAEREGAVIGFAQFVRHGDEKEITRIYVLPDHQGTGIGQNLIKAELRTDREINRLFAWVEAANRKGIRFYESGGFVMESSKTEEIHGERIELLKYVLNLG